MVLVSLNIGKPMAMVYEGTALETGIHKNPVNDPLFLSKLNVEGDGQADLVNHGGLDKAVCVYCAEHYFYWRTKLGRDFLYGGFGENFTVSGLLESEVHIGDVFEIGEAIVQISQPRQPCHKLAKKHAVPELPIQVQEKGFTGYYFRVLEEGIVEAGQTIRVIERDPLSVSVAEANRLKYYDKKNEAGMRRLLEVKALSESWRHSFEKRLGIVDLG